MVLTNFECWAHCGGAVVGNNGLLLDSRHVDMFNPRMVQQRLNTATGASPVSHISSNGYYGFSYVNAAHEDAADNGQSHNNSNAAAAVTHNTNNANTNTNNNNNNNNNNNRCVPSANDVNGTPMMHNNMDVGVGAVDGAAASFDNGFSAPQRCKKRYFVSDDDYANCALFNDVGAGVAVAGIDVCAAKRCRFDDDYAAAQYCNDFFSLSATQIGTQSCLMDTGDTAQPEHQQLQPQVDVNMGAANITNQTSNTTSNIHFIAQQQQHPQQQQQQQEQVINALPEPPVVVYQQQHNYQAKRRRQAIDFDASDDNSIVNVYHNNNIDTANQNNNNNNTFFNNNHEIKRLASSAAMYNSMDCGRRENGIGGGGENTGTIAEDEHGGHNGVGNTTYQMNQAKLPAYTLGQKTAAVGNSIVVPTVVADSKEYNSSISALYNKIHGGALYQFTAANAGNQPYMDDI